MNINMLLMAFFQLFCAFSWAQTGLIVTIDQENLSPGLNNFWDNHRAQYIENKAQNVYDHVYTVIGEKVRDDIYMKNIWQEALADNDQIDYVSFVHGGNQWIKDAWEVPRDSKKLRMVYSEGCKGGSGQEEFVSKYGALISAGHNKNTPHESASPYFSFPFLISWLEGKSFQDALETAWSTGKSALLHPQFFQIAQGIGRYAKAQDAIEGSKIEYSYHANAVPAELNINSKIENFSGENYEYLIDETLVDEIDASKIRFDVLQDVFNNQVLQKFMSMFS